MYSVEQMDPSMMANNACAQIATAKLSAGNQALRDQAILFRLPCEVMSGFHASPS